MIFFEIKFRKREKYIQNYGVGTRQLNNRSSIIDALGVIVFLAISAICGLSCFISALLIIAALVTLRPSAFLCIAIIASIFILVLGFSNFGITLLISLPKQFIALAISDGLWSAIEQFLIHNSNQRQYYILLPYLLLMILLVIEYKRNQNQIVKQNCIIKPEILDDAIDFGYELGGSHKPVLLTHKELNTHMYINGASGSGKTVAMLNFVIEAAKKKLPLIYIDGKGATDLESKISQIAKENKRVFKVFTLSPDLVPNPSSYDFLGSGTFTEKKNRIMQLFIEADAAGTAYYQDNLEAFINRVFMVIYQQGLKIDLYRFLLLITNINDLIELSKEDIVLEDGTSVNWQRYFEEIRDMKPEYSPRTRIITKLDPFIHSSYGYLFNITGKDNVINLSQSIKDGEIVLFLFDASAFSLDTKRVAKMVISDINATFAEFGKMQTPLKTFCCFDEFKNYETDAISKTISLHRSNGMHAIIGTQSLALINKEIGNGILANCQTHLVMASAEDDAKRFSEEFGKVDKIETSTRIRAEDQEVSDIITRKVRDYKIDKQDIKDIVVHSGQGFLNRKAIGASPVKIQVTKML